MASRNNRLKYPILLHQQREDMATARVMNRTRKKRRRVRRSPEQLSARVVRRST